MVRWQGWATLRRRGVKRKIGICAFFTTFQRTTSHTHMYSCKHNIPSNSCAYVSVKLCYDVWYECWRFSVSFPSYMHIYANAYTYLYVYIWGLWVAMRRCMDEKMRCDGEKSTIFHEFSSYSLHSSTALPLSQHTRYRFWGVTNFSYISLTVMKCYIHTLTHISYLNVWINKYVGAHELVYGFENKLCEWYIK